MIGRLSSRPRLCAAAMLLLLTAAPVSLDAADDRSLLSYPRISDYLGHQNDITLVGYSPNCNCRPSCSQPYCPDATSGEQPMEGMPSEGMPSEGAIASDMPSLAPEQFGGLGSDSWSINTNPAGYIDNPIVGTWFRLRYDDATNNTRPDRAEFFYARYGQAGGPGPVSPTDISPSRVDYQQFAPYFELLLFPRLSVFAEIPVQKVDINFPTSTNPGSPSVIIGNGGLADMNWGIKYALMVNECRYLTFQFKTYCPTGDATRGLGTNHVSLEPGLLYVSRLSDRSYFMGELRYWIPVSGTDFAGNVFRYGAGWGYDVIGATSMLNPYVSDDLRVTAVTEFVGWSIFNGRYTPPNEPGIPPVSVSAADNTIVNLKLGVRTTYGPRSFYVGWGHALTGAPFYDDLLRLEYRRMF